MRHPDAPIYTFWDYMRNRWPRDAGLRIDHLLLSAQAAERLVDAGVDRAVRGKEGASDHAPVWVMLRDEANPLRPVRAPALHVRRARPGAKPQAAKSGPRPLLVIDGDSFAHRMYHALPKNILRRGGTALVASGDRDTFQLASERTTILFPVRAGEMARVGPAEVRTRYGVDPAQVPDFIALRGDPSDKLPGAPGIGAGGAAELIRKYGSLEKALAAGRFPAHAQRLRLFRSIAVMDAKAPLPRLPDQQPTWRKAAALARRWQLKQLAGRLNALAADQMKGDRR